MNDLTQFDNVTGLVGVKAIVFFSGQYFSAIYGQNRWFPNHPTQEASCAIGCPTVPSDRHQGCGFHHHYDVDENKKFVSQIRGTADCIVLMECFGRIVTHENGFRSEKAKLIGVLNWDARTMFFTLPAGLNSQSIPPRASEYFDVPLVDEHTATQLIHRQRSRLLGVDPNISYKPTGQ